MTGMRIEIDLEALVHQSWKGIPRWQRLVLWFVRGSRKEIESEVASRIRKGQL